MTNVSALRGTSACCAGGSSRSRDEPESVRLEESPCTPTRPCVQRLPFALAGTGNISRSVDLASKVVAGFVDRDVERLLGLDPARERALARGRPCDMNSVCRGSIVSRARRTLTAFGVSAGILAAGPVKVSYSSCWTFERSGETRDQRIGTAHRHPRPVAWDRPLPLASIEEDRHGREVEEAWCGQPCFPGNRGEGADAQFEGEEAEEEVAREVGSGGL